jgi:hypothetical protein
MKLTENTKVRIKVPKHMYEAIQAELAKKPEMEESEETMEEADAQQASVEEVAAAMDKAVEFAKKLAKQIADKKGGSLTRKDFSRLIDNFRSKVKSFGPFKSVNGSEEINEEEMNEYVGMSPDQAQVVEILGSLIAAGGLGVAVKTALQMALDKIKSKKSSEAEPEAKEPVAEEMEEALDFESLMEAVKDLSKKKAEDKKKKLAEDKKKKELEAKKKKAEDDKKKKEAEAKKKVADAKKK